MNTIDLIFALILSYGLIKGMMKGFIVEIASLLALILGTYGAMHFSHFAAQLISQYVSWEEQYLNLAAFALTFIGIVWAISLLGNLLTRVVKFVMLGWLNRILGGVFGVLKFGLILTVIIYFFDLVNNQFEWVASNTLEESFLYSTMSALGPDLYPLLMEQEIPVV